MSLMCLIGTYPRNNKKRITNQIATLMGRVFRGPVELERNHAMIHDEYHRQAIISSINKLSLIASPLVHSLSISQDMRAKALAICNEMLYSATQWVGSGENLESEREALSKQLRNNEYLQTIEDWCFSIESRGKVDTPFQQIQKTLKKGHSHVVREINTFSRVQLVSECMTSLLQVPADRVHLEMDCFIPCAIEVFNRHVYLQMPIMATAIEFPPGISSCLSRILLSSQRLTPEGFLVFLLTPEGEEVNNLLRAALGHTGPLIHTFSHDPAGTVVLEVKIPCEFPSDTIQREIENTKTVRKALSGKQTQKRRDKKDKTKRAKPEKEHILTKKDKEAAQKDKEAARQNKQVSEFEDLITSSLPLEYTFPRRQEVYHEHKDPNARASWIWSGPTLFVDGSFWRSNSSMYLPGDRCCETSLLTESDVIHRSQCSLAREASFDGGSDSFTQKAADLKLNRPVVENDQHWEFRDYLCASPYFHTRPIYRPVWVAPEDIKVSDTAKTMAQEFMTVASNTWEASENPIPNVEKHGIPHPDKSDQGGWDYPYNHDYQVPLQPFNLSAYPEFAGDAKYLESILEPDDHGRPLREKGWVTKYQGSRVETYPVPTDRSISTVRTAEEYLTQMNVPGICNRTTEDLLFTYIQQDPTSIVLAFLGTPCLGALQILVNGEDTRKDIKYAPKPKQWCVLYRFRLARHTHQAIELANADR